MGTRKWNRVYIAAASSDIERAKRVRAQLIAGGVTVTSRWIDEVDKTGANPDDDVERRKRATSDVVDIDSSDVVLLLVPHGHYYKDTDRVASSGHPHTSIGAWWENGYAYRAGIPLVSSGPRAARTKTVFTALGEEFDHDVDAIIRILRVPSEEEGDGLDRPNPYVKE